MLGSSCAGSSFTSGLPKKCTLLKDYVYGEEVAVARIRAAFEPDDLEMARLAREAELEAFCASTNKYRREFKK